jgi:PPOX class probable F420-dependent enzyme
VFAVRDDTIVTAVDGKPKRTRRLQRLVNLASDPHCSLLVDHYEPDWSRLWWVRADGVATIVDPAEAPEELALLTSRYRQYRTAAAQIGPLISVRVTRWTGWVPSGTRQAKSDHVRSDG